MDNGTEFVNDRLIEYCLGNGIELTRSRPYRKNDQAWIEQKNGAIVRKLLGYRRFEGLTAARAITRLYGASRLFVNIFQPSFKLASKHRDGAKPPKVTKRYHPPLTPCDRLLPSEGVPPATKDKLREISAQLDTLKLLEEMPAVQAYLTALAEGETPPAMGSEPPNLATFVASLSSAWRNGEVRPTFSLDAKPRYLLSLQTIAAPAPRPLLQEVATSKMKMAPAKMPAKLQRKPQPVYAMPGNTRIQALRMAWPIVARRLEGMPNISAMQLFDELCVQFPGRFTPRQYSALLRRVNRWRDDARERGVLVGTKTYRVFNDKWSGCKRDIFADHWTEMVECLEEHPNQTALELLVGFQVRYPGRYSQRQLHTLQKRVRVWRPQAVQRLISEVSRTPNQTSLETSR